MDLLSYFYSQGANVLCFCSVLIVVQDCQNIHTAILKIRDRMYKSTNVLYFSKKFRKSSRKQKLELYVICNFCFAIYVMQTFQKGKQICILWS